MPGYGYSNLLDDPDIQKYLSAYEPGYDQMPAVNPSFANDPDVSEFAGLPPMQSQQQIDQYNAPAPQGQPSPEALKLGGALGMPQPQSQSQIDRFNGMPEQDEPILSRVSGVPGALQDKAEASLQSQRAADAELIKQREAEVAAQREHDQMMRDVYDEQRAKLEAQRDEQRAELDKKNAAAQSYLKESEEIAKEKDAPIDPGKYMSDIGAGGKLVSVIAAAAYGFINPKGTMAGQTPILDILNQNIDRDIAAQRATIANNQDQRQNRLRLLSAKMGSVDAAQGRLRIEIANLGDKMLDAEIKGAGSAAAPDGIEAAKAALKAQREKGALEMQEALYRMQPKPKPGANADPLAKEKKVADLTKSWTDQGIPADEQSKRLETLGLGGSLAGRGKPKEQEEKPLSKEQTNAETRAKEAAWLAQEAAALQSKDVWGMGVPKREDAARLERWEQRAKTYNAGRFSDLSNQPGDKIAAATQEYGIPSRFETNAATKSNVQSWEEQARKERERAAALLGRALNPDEVPPDPTPGFTFNKRK